MFKAISDLSLFGKHYYRTLTFWNVVILCLLALIDVASFSRDLFLHDHYRFLKILPLLIAMAVCVFFGFAMFRIWLSRMQRLLVVAHESETTELLKKMAGDFLRLFALLILSVFIGLFIAQSLPL